MILHSANRYIQSAEMTRITCQMKARLKSALEINHIAEVYYKSCHNNAIEL